VKVSILSAVFNESRHIDEMIDSVRSQSHSDWELLFVDDGSTDETPEKISRAAKSDQRIKLISKGVKLGKVGAFNRAYTAATGALIALLAGDDRLPPTSLEDRVAAFSNVDQGQQAVAFFKLRTFSADAKFDGMVIPRGDSSSTSGGSITMNSSNAKKAFPIPETLAAEDIWLRYAATGPGSTVINRPHIVLEYRIHAGNTNPRAKPFREMSPAMHRRHLAYAALLEADGIQLDNEVRERLTHLREAEELRNAGLTWRLFNYQALALRDRAAFACMSNAVLWSIRGHFFKLMSGRRSG
jgi:glycosyltransferase involved in cell wall biosynthesis